MSKRPLFVQLFSSFLVITILLLFVFVLLAGNTFRGFYENRISDDLLARAELVKDQFVYNLSIRFYSRLQDTVTNLGKESNTRLTVIDPYGVILADSVKKEKSNLMASQFSQPEFQEAIKGRVGVSSRYDELSSEDIMYVAVPITDVGEVLGVLRLSAPITSLNQTLLEIYIQLIIGALICALIIGLLSWYVSRRMSKPLEEIKNTAEKIMAGDFSSNLQFKSSATVEVQSLGEAINKMAEQLEKRIETILSQKSELDGVLSSMTEGVLSVEKDLRIIHINQSAAKMLGTSRDYAKGKLISEIVKNPDIERFIVNSIDKDHIEEEELKLNDKKQSVLRLRGSPLKKSTGYKTGVVIVINDITNIILAEKQRRDFVTNVSHELRTPLTSIQGFAETLLNPAVKDPNEIKKFIDIIHKHATRLGALIEDILALSRLEKDAENNQIVLSKGSLKDCLKNAIDICKEKAEKQNIQITLIANEDRHIKINAHLLEQAIVNLIDNALKYSENNTRIEVELEILDEEASIHVKDYGSGIPEKHLSRLFERFYRIDKSRTRSVGGTGLGLAIVKHVAQAHSGRVEVQSELGKGSKFSVSLPLEPS